MHALGIAGELTQGFDIGREPRQTVGGALLAIEQPISNATALADPLSHRSRRVLEQGFRRARASARERHNADRRGFRLIQHG